MNPRGPSRSLAALLGTKIRVHREQRDWTQDRLGREVHTTGDFIGKCERGVRVPGPKVCEKLDEVFGTGGYFTDHAPYARQSLAPDWLLRFFDAEAQARVIRVFQAQVVNGLFQTEDYARAVIGSGKLPNVDELVTTRLDRQALLDRKDPPRLWIVYEESVLHRRIDVPGVTKAQLHRLLELARRTNVVIQIIPARIGMHAGLDGSFQVLTLEDGQEVGYIEGLAGGRLIDDPVKVENMTLTFELVRSHALSISDSFQLIERTMEDQ